VISTPFGGARIAPPWFHNAPTLRNQDLWRGLVWAVVPMASANDGTGFAFVRSGRELVRGNANTHPGGVRLAGEANGIALRSVSAGMAFDSKLPSQVPYSCFAFLVKRSSPGSIESLISCTGSGGGGWTFQVNYGSGQLGLTRWGIADQPTTVLGAVPTLTPVCVGMSHNGTTARFFMQGRFENLASGSNAAQSGSQLNHLFHQNGSAATADTSVYVAYAWNRVLSDGEFFALNQDPWAVVRPMELPWTSVGVGGGGGGSGARVFVPAFIG
jgi:hypothetical protein